MEQFFTPTRRQQDRWERLRGDSFEYTEVELCCTCGRFPSLPLGLERFADLSRWRRDAQHALDRRKCVLVVNESGNDFDFLNHDLQDFRSNIAAKMQAASGLEQTLTLDYGSDIISTGEVGIFWRAVATSNSVNLTIHDYVRNLAGLPSSGPLLSQHSCERVHRFRPLNSTGSVSRKNTVVLLRRCKGRILRSN
jgi:hypothetical protein